MKKISLALTALLSLSLLNCAAETGDESVDQREEATMGEQAAALTSADTGSAPAPAEDTAAEKGKKKKKAETQTYLTVTISDVIVSSY